MSISKVCAWCNKRKLLEEFSLLKTGYRKAHCKPCGVKDAVAWQTANRRHVTERNKRKRHADPLQSRDLKRVYRYRMKPGEYDERVKQQKGKCLICQQEKKLYVDHCHDTMKVRGLLCHHCNVGIGSLKHDMKIIQAALKYLS